MSHLMNYPNGLRSRKQKVQMFFFEKGILTWQDGIWQDGVWESGTWEYGIWEGGYKSIGAIQTNRTII